MTHRLFIAATITVSLTLVGCSKDKKKVEKPATMAADPSPNQTSETNTKPKTEVATGEVREAILILHRVHFPYDSSVLIPQSREALTDAASKLANHPDVSIFVQGHADARGTTEYNIALGDRRAQVVAEYLKRSGIDAARLKTISYGEEQPLDASAGSNAFAKNRRVDFKLMKGSIKLVIEAGATVDDSGATQP